VPLTLPVFVLPQRTRLKTVESLRSSKRRIVVVATDVAARGLDISSVATVVHYDAARNVGTFVHRAGRTAVRSLLCRGAV
jgi:superfamily II DNA/RNA helicase